MQRVAAGGLDAEGSLSYIRFGRADAASFIRRLGPQENIIERGTHHETPLSLAVGCIAARSWLQPRTDRAYRRRSPESQRAAGLRLEHKQQQQSSGHISKLRQQHE